MIPELVDSVMEPLELDDVLRRFDPIVTFKAVEFRELPECQCSSPDCVELPGEAVISYQHWIPPKCGRPGYYSHRHTMVVNGGCLGWELRLLARADVPRVAEKLTVEILMIKKERV